MILIIGGAGQGKLDYVLQKTGYGPAQVARTPEEARTRPVFAGLEDWPELDETALLEANPGVILICDEVGCGVVPMDKEDRSWRERVGRTCCTLAERADCVIRMYCGIPSILKGEPEWN